MKETKRLYFEDPYKVEFEAIVLGKLIHEGKPALVLEQTCFYPESGGQPADRGTIEGIEVENVLEEGSEILHLLKEDLLKDRVRGKIDWQVRFDHMQQHSGQHILSQSFYELLGGETLSFHLGKESSNVEIGLEKVSEDEVERVERRANEIIFEDREIKSYFVPQERINQIPLRKPPKKEGMIRVIEVSGFDYSACGGTHCRRAGEIGLLKITKWERIRDNLRFGFLCGERALKDYAWKNKILRELSTRLTVHEKDISSSMEKLFEELKSLKKRTRKLQERMAFYEAQEVIKNSKGKVIKEIFKERTPEEAKLLALNITRQGDFVVLYGLEIGSRGHLIFACSRNLPFDMRELIPIVSSLMRGKGGGSESLVEISTEEKANLELALSKAYEFIHISKK